MRVFDLLVRSAAMSPDATAIAHHERNMTYRQLYQASVALGRHLKELSLPEGTRIGLLFENSVEYAVSFFAIFQAGYIAVPMDTSLDADSLRYLLTDCEARVLIAGFRFRKILPALVSDGSTIEHVISDRHMSTGRNDLQVELMGDIIGSPEEDAAGMEVPEFIPPETDSPAELAAIFYTSGSTGTPKGVMLSHRNLVSNTLATVEYLKLTGSDSVIVILPFYYIYGNSLLLTHIACGGRAVIDNRFMYPEVVLDTMEEKAVTGFSGVPSNFMILLSSSTFTKRKLPSLRYFTQAGGAMAPEIIRRLMSAFPGKEIFIMYGQTEAAPRVTYLPPERLKDKLGSIGIPVPGVQVTVTDENGNELPPGEVGEIMVTGPNVMMGYWNQSDEEREVLREGRLFTGDLAKKDNEGFIFVVGRKKEIIKTGGNRVSVKEIEECLVQCDRILETAVFGVDDPILGEAIKAVVVTRPDLPMTEKDVADFCRAHLASHKVPKFIEFADSLPKQESGKIDKIKLKTGRRNSHKNTGELSQ
ncbi:MAG: acyl--CoA ligase [Candidatus Zixiibacteriota bacterium]|nr:MAG: acyl--CoA ligase [candidate division Zixibacteria bacterium]